MFVLGTAGHIDHGKSSLIKAMTGIDPDRLPEEAERGMTIDLGFAWLRLPDGREIGMIDVPGHERFVRNMVAGAGGVNAAMLVVAADDGWMPQTQEHLDILNMLDVRHGLVALTKVDLVERDWLKLVESDVKSKLTSTFLTDAPIVPVSSVTGEGIDNVIAAIAEISEKLQVVEDIDKSRLFVDRAFVLTGIGVVVTGTSRGGGFSGDADIFHFPSGKRMKVRGLQSHGCKVDRVGAGYRVAINLSGIARDEIRRGDVVTGFRYDKRPSYFAVHIRNLHNSTITLKEGRKLLLILGTTETEAIIRPFNNDGIAPGEAELAILKTTEPLAAFIKDRFILRLPTPQVTVGGGQILDILNNYPRRKSLPLLRRYLKARIKGDLKTILLTELDKGIFNPSASFLAYSNFSTESIRIAVSSLIDENQVIRYGDYLAASGKVDGIFARIKTELAKVHEKNSYLPGLTEDELARFTGHPVDEQFHLLLRYLEQSGDMGRSRQFYHLPGFTPGLDEKMKKEADGIVARTRKAGHNYLTFGEIETCFPGSRNTLNFLRDSGRLKSIGNQSITTDSIWNDIISYIEEKLEGDGQLTVAEFRDRFGNSRKYALPVLEYLDSLKITHRQDDVRVKGSRFGERYSL
jgi:selenocysteine-specific elongation factor